MYVHHGYRHHHLLQAEKAGGSASTASAGRSEWLCVTEALLYPRNSGTEKDTLVSIENRLLGTVTQTVTFKLVARCSPPIKVSESGALKRAKQQTKYLTARPTHAGLVCLLRTISYSIPPAATLTRAFYLRVRESKD